MPSSVRRLRHAICEYHELSSI